MMTLRRTVFVIGAFWLALPAGQACAQGYLSPTQDTWLDEQWANNNYGGDTELRARNRNNRNRRPLIQFDLTSVPANANVTQAELWLYASEADSSGNPVNVYRVTDSWSEYSADWNNTANDYDSTVWASFTPTGNGFYRIDITDLVQSWVCGGFDNDGVMLIPTSNNDESRYISREYYYYYGPRLYVDTSGTGGCAPPPPPPVVADWHLDECDLGIAGSTITDYGPNGLDATTVGGVDIENDGQLCSAGEFDGTSGYAVVPDSAQIDLTDGFSVAVWVRHDNAPLKDWEAILAKGDLAYRLHLNGGCEISDTLPGNVQHGFTLGLNGGCDGADLNSNVVPQAGVWYHVAATFDGSTMNIYVDGVLLSSASYNQPIGTNNYDLFIGENSQQRGRYWSGDIDELTVWNGAISATEVVEHMNRTRPCTNCSNVSFAVVHDGYGIHCLDEVVEIQVVDSLTGNPRTDYTDQITLDTQTGFGTWTLVSGSGTFDDATAGDGQATYDWPLGESTAQFALSYPQGPTSVDVDVYQTSNTTLRDDDTEGTLEYSASGFTFSEAPLGNPPSGAIPPFASARTAGTDIPVYLAAYGQTPDDPVCGVIETYTGPQNLKFWFTRDDPATGAVAVTVDGIAIADNEAGTAAQAVTFTNGQAAVTAKYKDAGRIVISAKDDSVVHADLPNGIRGGTASFPVKPAEFLLQNIEDAGGNPNPAANGPSDPVFTAAGAPFSVTVTALDAEGDVTPNYGRESTPETVKLTGNLVAPAAGANPAIAQAPGFGPFSAGTATGNAFAWPEVGIITLVPSVGDGDYLGGGDVVGTTSGDVGRFIPDRFLVAGNTPEFGTTCTSGGFSYLGEPLQFVVPPVVTFTAVAVGGSQTTNYTGAFFKVDNSTLQNRSYTATTGSLDLSGLPPTSADPIVADTGGGGRLTFDSGTGVVFQRVSPEAPFDADIGLGIELRDADGVASDPDPVTFSTIAFSDGANIRYGRVRISNALGSELVNLAAPMRVEYFADAATGFVPHTDDVCTDAVTISLGNFTNNLQAGETCVVDSGNPGASGAGCAAAGPAGQRFRVPALGGDFNLFLQAPGAGNDGSVRIFGDVPAWLEYDWNGSSPGLEDPQGIATFGIFDDNGKRIYTREIYR